MACCPTIIGGPVNVTVAGDDIPGGRVKLTTEGSLIVKANTKTQSDRDTGLGHTRSRNNSYIEGTFILSRGLFSTEDLFGFTGDAGGAAPIFNDGISGIADIQCACGLTVTLESECGDVWSMIAAAETSGGEQDIYEGTASFRFSSPFPIREFSRS